MVERQRKYGEDDSEMDHNCFTEKRDPPLNTSFLKDFEGVPELVDSGEGRGGHVYLNVYSHINAKDSGFNAIAVQTAHEFGVGLRECKYLRGDSENAGFIFYRFRCMRHARGNEHKTKFYQISVRFQKKSQCNCTMEKSTSSLGNAI